MMENLQPRSSLHLGSRFLEDAFLVLDLQAVCLGYGQIEWRENAQLFEMEFSNVHEQDGRYQQAC